MDTVYLNGDFLDASEATVSVFDRGFLFADGIYEVIPCYGGRLFRLPEHLQRLDNSLQAIGMQNPHDEAGWAAILEQLLETNGRQHADSAVYLQITRGSTGNRDHGIPSNTPPTIFACLSALKPVADAIKTEGVAAITLPDSRWLHCHIKAIALLPNVLLRETAVEQGANEALLVRDGHLVEGSTSNVFLVRDGQLFTPPLQQEMLPGVTRQLLVELGQANGMPVIEEAIPTTALAQAEEIWLSSSTREIYPVTSLNGKTVGNGKPGPAWQKMYQALQDYKASYREGSSDE